MLAAKRNPMERKIKSTDELQIEIAKFAERHYWLWRYFSFFPLLASFVSFNALLIIFWGGGGGIKSLENIHSRGNAE